MHLLLPFLWFSIPLIFYSFEYYVAWVTFSIECILELLSFNCLAAYLLLPLSHSHSRLHSKLAIVREMLHKWGWARWFTLLIRDGVADTPHMTLTIFHLILIGSHLGCLLNCNIIKSADSIVMWCDAKWWIVSRNQLLLVVLVCWLRFFPFYLSRCSSSADSALLSQFSSHLQMRVKVRLAQNGVKEMTMKMFHISHFTFHISHISHLANSEAAQCTRCTLHDGGGV